MRRECRTTTSSCFVYSEDVPTSIRAFQRSRHPVTTYAEIAPTPPLIEHVECYWTGYSDRSGGGRRSTVLPDGCMDIIFNLGDLPSPGVDADRDSRSYVIGTMRRPAEVTAHGRVDLIGIRFRPGVLPALLRTRADELTDASADLDVFWHVGTLIDRLREKAVSERIRLLESYLRSHIGGAAGPHPAAAIACRLLERTHGRLTVDTLHTASGVSVRHLRRLFSEYVGISPKEACRVARFRSAVCLTNTSANLAQVALECGYFDQAHFTREFRTFAGVTPSVYRERRG